MVRSRHASRAASALPHTAARDTLKRRHKPYKTEKSTVLAKKRKLNYKTTYKGDVPPGYTFLELGTPDLADLCKELSRKRNLPVNVVSAEPVSVSAQNPNKISHHIHRIGYSFRCEVVEEACEALGYVLYDGSFIKTRDLQKKIYQDSFLAQTFAKYGKKWDGDGFVGKDTPDQVRAAIKELFPLIPPMDLDQIVSHAWEKGTKRVGSASDMSLARRVQLATIARIRHTYTDYDALLKSFGDWKEVRRIIEPDCLKKLMEWRGENSDGQDEGLEEIVRETIVIDDDDDEDADDGYGSNDTDDDSDSSIIEITHRPAALHDLRAEQANERDHRYFRRLEQPPRRTVADRSDIARQMISAAKNQTHNWPSAIAPARGDPAAHPRSMPVDARPIYIQPHDEHPQQVFVDGRWWQRVPDAPHRYVGPASPYTPHERPVQSIENDDDSKTITHGYTTRASTTAYHSRPVTPLPERRENQGRQIIDLSQDSPSYAQPFTGVRRAHPVPRSYHAGEVVDLTSPNRYVEQPARQPQVVRVSSGEDRRTFAPIPVGEYGYPAKSQRTTQLRRAEDAIGSGQHPELSVPEYDPTRPLLDGHAGYDSEGPAQHARAAQRNHQVERATVNRMPYTEQPQVQYHGNAAGSEHYGAAYQRPEPQSRGAPAPVHGAPAPIQQMTRELAYPPRFPAAPVAPPMGQGIVRRDVALRWPGPAPPPYKGPAFDPPRGFHPPPYNGRPLYPPHLPPR